MSAWQTRKVYAAEKAMPRFGEPLSVAEAERFIAKVKNSVWWKNRTAVSDVDLVIQGDIRGKVPWAGAVKESWKKGKLWIHARNLYIDYIIHELTHLIAWPKPHHPTHDPVWAQFYIYLLGAWASADYAEKMRRKFDEKGVLYGMSHLP